MRAAIDRHEGVGLDAVAVRRWVRTSAAAALVLGVVAIAAAGLIPFGAYRAVADFVARDGSMEAFTPERLPQAQLLLRLAGGFLVVLAALVRALERRIAALSAPLAAPVRSAPAHVRVAAARMAAGLRSPLTPIAVVTLLGFWAFYASQGLALEQAGVLDHYDALFQSDPPRVIVDLTYPYPNGYRTTTHPLVVMLFNPLGSFFKLFTDRYATAGVILNSLFGALAVVLAQVFFRALGMSLWDGLLWSLIVGFSTAHLVFSAVPETHILTGSALTLAAILVARNAGRLPMLLAGVVMFGITITNLVPATILNACRYATRETLQRLGARTTLWAMITTGARYALAVVAVGAVCSLWQFARYPQVKLFFWPPHYSTGGIFDYFETFGSARDVGLVAAQSVSHTFLYSVVAPRPYFPELELFAYQLPDSLETVDCTTACRELTLADPVEREETSHFPVLSFQSGVLPAFRPRGWPVAILWLALLGTAATAAVRAPDKLPPVFWGLAGCVVFFFLFYSLYGDDRFLFASHWTFPLVGCVAIALRPHWERPWMKAALGALVLGLALNNVAFLWRAISVFSSAD